jgi:hypothetical protein
MCLMQHDVGYWRCARCWGHPVNPHDCDVVILAEVHPVCAVQWAELLLTCEEPPA